MAENGVGQEKSAIGFRIATKSRPKVAVTVEAEKEHRQLILGVSDTGVLQAADSAVEQQREYVIPKLENTYKAGVGKFVPSFVPESSTAAVSGTAEDRYERAAAPDQPAITTFGLEVRGRKVNAQETGTTGNDRPLVPVGAKDEAAQLKEDLEQLPEEATVDDYDSLPVEQFGKALLRGLGWSEGQGVGRKRQVVEPKQVIRRPDRLGLGANPAAAPPDKRPRKMGDKPKQDLVAAPAADGTVRHRVGLDEKLVPRASLQAGPAVGKVMQLVGGRHQGLTCVVKEILAAGGAGASNRVLVELRPSSEVVEVAEGDLADRGSSRGAATAAGDGGSSSRQQQQSRENEKAQNSRDSSYSRERGQQRRDSGTERHRDGSSGKDSQHRDGRHSSHRHHDPQRQPHDSHDADDRQGDGQRRNEGQQRQQQRSQVLPPHRLWVAPLIRVRIVDKRLQQGRLYLKKGVVLDVAPDGTCDVQMEEGRQVVAAHQDELETVVPKEAGAAVMVVQGKHKGRKGRLLQVSLSSGAAALQLVGDLAVERLLLDDVAQFMGHLEEEED